MKNQADRNKTFIHSLAARVRGSALALAAAGTVVLATLFSPLHPASAKDSGGVSIQAETDGISTVFSASAAGSVTDMMVRVIGPDGLVFEARGDEPSVQWVPTADVQDGIYHWEVRAVSTATGNGSGQAEATRTHVASGSFRVVNGVLAPATRGAETPAAPSLTSRVGDAILDFLFPSAHAQSGDFDDSVQIVRDTGTNPTLSFLDPDLDPSAALWRVRMVPGENDHLEFRYCDFAVIACADGSEIVPLVIKSDTGNVGINRTAPIYDLDVGGEIRGDIIRAGFGSSTSPAFRFGDELSGLSSPLEETLSLLTNAVERVRILSNGDAGFGTAAPVSTIHVLRDTDAQITVENVSGTSAERVPFRLVNNGKTRFVIANTAGAGSTWTFDNAGGSFQISRVGTGVAEFKVFSNGNAEFIGNVTANGVVLSSSKTRKTDFRDVDEVDILDRVSDLDIMHWRYKHEAEEAAHIGPMAEDFQQLFGLGDGNTLNLVDTTGITLAAIQGLREENRARLAELEAENRALRARLAEIDEIRAELDALKTAR